MYSPPLGLVENTKLFLLLAVGKCAIFMSVAKLVTEEEIMDITVLILQIVTIVVSVCTLAFNLLSTSRENSKKNYIKVVTEQRLKNKSIIRDNIKNLLAYSNAHTLDSLTDETVKKCAESAAAIETVLKDVYPEDNEVLKAVNNLVSEIAKQLATGNNAQAVACARQKVLREFSVYDLADWRFIKQQSTGRKTDTDDFDKIYKDTLKKFNK